MHRRKYLAGVSTAVAVSGLAGCSEDDGDNGSSSSGPNNSPKDPIEDFYQALDDLDKDLYTNILHSESPDENSASELEDPQLENIDWTVEQVSVAAEDPNESTIRDEIGQTYSDEDDLEQIIDAANNANNSAIVEAEAEATTSGRTETVSQTFIVATEDGRYKLLG